MSKAVSKAPYSGQATSAPPTDGDGRTDGRGRTPKYQPNLREPEPCALPAGAARRRLRRPQNRLG